MNSNLFDLNAKFTVTDDDNDFTFEIAEPGAKRVKNPGLLSIGPLMTEFPSLESEATRRAKDELAALDSNEGTPRRTIGKHKGSYSTIFEAGADMPQGPAALRRGVTDGAGGLPSPPARIASPRMSSFMEMQAEIEQMGTIWDMTPIATCILSSADTGDERAATPPYSDSDSDGLPKHTKICRHYLRGHCRRGAKCNFLHDVSVFKPDDQKVFLGGLPQSIDCDTIIREMAKQGYTVVNRPHIHARGFTPKVCIETVERARALVKKGYINICGKRVDVRRYQDKKGNSMAQRAVFIGGLPMGTNGQVLSRALFQLGFMVRKPPVVRDGYAPKVEMSTADQANALIVLGRIRILGKTVDIRAWVAPRKVPRGRSVSPPNEAKTLFSSMKAVAGSWPPRSVAIAPIASNADGIW